MNHTIPERFAAQAARRPDACALRAAGASVTYGELDRRANRLAHRLLGLGLRPEQPVAVLLERSPDLVVALLAVAKAGGCYLPLHSADPIERMQGIVDDTAAPVLLADTASRRGGLPHTDHVLIVDRGDATRGLPETAPAVDVPTDALAYVIHTSGSTGRPKGVAVTHRHVTELVDDPCWATGRHERVLMVAPYAFNVSTYELWVPLLRGGTVVLAPPGRPDVAMLRRLVAAEGVTAAHLTAGLFRVIAEEDPGALAGLSEVLTGGDVIAPAAVRRVLDACPDITVRAMYGATEATLFSTSNPMSGTARPGTAVPVGRPMQGVAVRVLDEALAPVAAGGTGEVYLSGRLARGYHGRPALTAERFVADPYGEPGARMYRTGDLARWTGDGLLEFVGRADGQVKVRGFRVELGEVEAALAEHPQVRHVAAAGYRDDDGGLRLAAYYVPVHGRLDAADLRAHARATLPDYMVPNALLPMEALPLTPNGKVDRRALPAPETGVAADDDPPDPLQAVLCAVFAEVLGCGTVGVHASFFDLGGQSLLAMRLIARIQARLGVELSMADLFDSPTVAELAAVVGERQAPAAGRPRETP
ncbi:non-ribosomal peptide synthetase [Spirillospora sp. NPDC049024]